ncbi:hypothetical protein KC332_g17381 [Hortaea werneckii]|uniref:GED domain-containing protein n=2 Tax=Hortaea werneckii TaxID=91943 RepID=A0A3M7I1W4_HORWE|nr:hypothetical protein KC358_g17556 [Hortaea werneckii]OTA31676.1 hypothetical protein BTJ68_07785 [Hortaea werneckii EXF-2000]KAI6793210.1 hypothetical protein KC350_g17434 [Hortaea werneckii]KAI6898289.1 hypothetical protein KC348_g17487 [Hortaea werneckii]KAI6919072.1 hypothetical protein KC341_g17542 [Hortaea werneckii]
MPKRERDQNISTDTTGLDSLKHDDTQAILDVLDRLRQEGIEEDVSFPRLVVAGDTSAGKSRVLWRLTGILFPSGDGVVTRFVVEVAMRPAAESEINITIRPDQNREKAQLQKLRGFRRKLTSLSDYIGVHEEAAEALGVNDGQTSLLRDVLHIDIKGPDCAPLTILDIPGLIQATSKSVTKEDMLISHELVKLYISDERTLILAIISATNDLVNQNVTEKTREVDPEGKRTLGVITKADAVTGQREEAWMQVALNQEINLQLGWHVLVNKIENDEDATLDKIGRAEAKFFKSKRFANLKTEQLGLSTLRERLSKVLHDSLVEALPQLEEQFEVKREQAQRKLDLLGTARCDPKSQRLFISNISTAFQGRISSAVAGSYIDPYFASDAKPHLKLRADIEALNLDYAEAMRAYGASISIDGVTNKGNIGQNTDEARTNVYDSWANGRPAFDRKQALSWVEAESKRSRGQELPGTVNPQTVALLFRMLSQDWEAQSRAHLGRFCEVCGKFIKTLIRDCVGEDTSDVPKKFRHLRLYPELRKAWNEANACLSNLANDERKHPKTYNPLFVVLSEKYRTQRTMKLVNEHVARQNEAFHGYHSEDARQSVDVQALESSIEAAKTNYTDMDRYAAEQTLDQVAACYNCVLYVFIDAVIKQMIERSIVDQITQIVSAAWVSGLSEADMDQLVAEKGSVKKERERLERLVQKMTMGLKALKEDLAGYYETSDVPL